MPRHTVLAWCLLACAGTSAHATTVYRCVDSANHVSFRQQGCPEEMIGKPQKISYVSTDHSNPRRRAPSSKPRASQGEARELVVVGTHHDKCGSQLTTRDRRRAIIEKRIVPGMTQEDVQSALGTPDRVTTTNGRTQWRYESERGRSRTVTLDNEGCVTTKR